MTCFYKNFTLCKVVVFLQLFFCALLFYPLKSFANKNAFEVGLEYPMQLGFHWKKRYDLKTYSRLGVGFARINLLNDLTSVPYLKTYINQREMDFIIDFLQGSFYSEFRLGWNKSSYQGLYYEFGLANFWTYQSLFAREALDSFGFLKHSPSVLGSTYKFNAFVQAVTAHLGYRHPLGDSLGLSAELGLVKPLSFWLLSLKSPSGKDLSSDFDHFALFRFLLRKAWIPTASLWLQFEF